MLLGMARSMMSSLVVGPITPIRSPQTSPTVPPMRPTGVATAGSSALFLSLALAASPVAGAAEIFSASYSPMGHPQIMTLSEKEDTHPFGSFASSPLMFLSGDTGARSDTKAAMALGAQTTTFFMSKIIAASYSKGKAGSIASFNEDDEHSGYRYFGPVKPHGIHFMVDNPLDGTGLDLTLKKGKLAAAAEIGDLSAQLRRSEELHQAALDAMIASNKNADNTPILAVRNTAGQGFGMLKTKRSKAAKNKKKAPWKIAAEACTHEHHPVVPEAPHRGRSRRY